MSEREFENYLVLLSRLLRLSRAQRDAIGVELRDHLEERLGVLTARGVSREDAVRMALEEFGDTASLAGEFSEIARNRKRRWMMRVTTGTIAATAATILIAMALWPDPQAGPAPQRATAQQSEAGEAATAEAATTPTVGDGVPTEAKLNAASAEKLAKLSTVQFVDSPLEEVLVTFARNADVQFYVDKKSLEEFGGVSTDTPITFNLKNVPLDMILDLMFAQLDLAYYLRGGVAIVTTRDEADLTLSNQVYNVNDLLIPALPDGNYASAGPLQKLREDVSRIKENLITSPNGAEEAVKRALIEIGQFEIQLKQSTATVEMYQSRSQELIRLMMACIEPDSWDEVGGPGSIQFYKGALVISQTSEAHRQVAKFLEEIRQATAGNPDIPGVKRSRNRGGGFGGGSRGGGLGGGSFGGGRGGGRF